MSSELERLLREARQAMPLPDEQATERAEESRLQSSDAGDGERVRSCSWAPR